MKNKNILIVICIILFFSCRKDKDTTLVNDLFFECYDETDFGKLEPESYLGLPKDCISILFEENFSDNENNWTERNDGDFDFSVNNNLYNLECIANFNFHLYIPSINQLIANYQIDADIKTLEGGNNGMSLTWGSLNGLENIYYFGITKSRKFFVGYRQDDTVQPLIVPLTFSSSIQSNNFNKLTVRYFDGMHYFFINQTLVYSTDSINDFGSTHGLRSGALTKNQVDNYRFSTIGT